MESYARACVCVTVYGHLGDKPTGRQPTGRHFGQLGDNIGRVIKDINIGNILEIILH